MWKSPFRGRTGTSAGMSCSHSAPGVAAPSTICDTYADVSLPSSGGRKSFGLQPVLRPLGRA